jgi:hypothetical protein
MSRIEPAVLRLGWLRSTAACDQHVLDAADRIIDRIARAVSS